jgi:hypothetical protein
MTADNESRDSEEFDLMREDVFEIAANAVSFHGANERTPRIVQAARAVLVDGMRPADAAAKFGFPRERISEAVGRIRDKWQAICADNGWVTETFSLPPRLADLIRQIESDAIEPLLQEALLKREKKMKLSSSKMPALKVAEKKPAAYRNKPAKKT